MDRIEQLLLAALSPRLHHSADAASVAQPVGVRSVDTPLTNRFQRVVDARIANSNNAVLTQHVADAHAEAMLSPMSVTPLQHHHNHTQDGNVSSDGNQSEDSHRMHLQRYLTAKDVCNDHSSNATSLERLLATHRKSSDVQPNRERLHSADSGSHSSATVVADDDDTASHDSATVKQSPTRSSSKQSNASLSAVVSSSGLVLSPDANSAFSSVPSRHVSKEDATAAANANGVVEMLASNGNEIDQHFHTATPTNDYNDHHDNINTSTTNYNYPIAMRFSGMSDAARTELSNDDSSTDSNQCIPNTLHRTSLTRNNNTHNKNNNCNIQTISDKNDNCNHSMSDSNLLARTPSMRTNEVQMDVSRTLSSSSFHSSPEIRKTRSIESMLFPTVECTRVGADNRSDREESPAACCDDEIKYCDTVSPAFNNVSGSAPPCRSSSISSLSTTTAAAAGPTTNSATSPVATPLRKDNDIHQLRLSEELKMESTRTDNDCHVEV